MRVLFDIGTYPVFWLEVVEAGGLYAGVEGVI